MPDAIAFETMQAMQAMQFSTAYSTAVTKLGMESQEVAAQTIEKMLPPPVVSDQQHVIDTYA